MRYWLTLRHAARSSEPSEILIHGPIGRGLFDDSGVSGREFTEALNSIPRGKRVVVGINSPGGSIHDGLAIYNAIKRRAEDVTARIDGWACSMASIIPLAAGRVVTPRSSEWMIHNPRFLFLADVDANELREYADQLDKEAEMLAQIYAEHTGQSIEDVKAAMNKTTWFTGAEAAAWGLADEVTSDSVNLESFDFAALGIENIPARVVARINRAAPPAQPVTRGTMQLTERLAARGIISAATITDEAAVAEISQRLDDQNAALANERAALTAEKEAHEKTRLAFAEYVVNVAVKAGKIADTKEARERWARVVIAAGPEALDDIKTEPAKPVIPQGAAAPVPAATGNPSDNPQDAKPRLPRDVWQEQLAAYYNRN